MFDYICMHIHLVRQSFLYDFILHLFVKLFKCESNQLYLFENDKRVIAETDNVDLVLYINDDYDVIFMNKEELIDNEATTGNDMKNDYLFILPILLVIIVLVIYIIVKNKKK